MDPEEIRIELFKRRRQVTITAISRKLGCSRQAIYMVIDRKFISDRIMTAVAETIGKDKKAVFPEYYLKKGAGKKRLHHERQPSL